jgi:chromosome segregation ATPase
MQQKDQLDVNRALAKKSENSGLELLELPVAPPFSFDDANCVLDIEVRADQLLLYIDKITSLADRACNTAIRQTETAQLLERSRSVELGSLRDQLDKQRGQYQEQQLTLVRLEHESRAQIATLENRLQEIERHRDSVGVQAELRKLQAENTALADQLAAARADSNAASRKPAATDQELTELRQQLAQREETIENKNRAIKETERGYISKIKELEGRLSAVESDLQTQEAQLKEKEAILKLSVVKELEVGNLIKRLSAECATLSSQLQERNQKLGEIEASKSNPIGDAKIWRRMITRLQDETQ